ncbi:hypothetical protein E2C01_075381 [Portunus trituberculatus]|uniref:Uncharacterized protein n=1 Tax=Portunus trituberculatus TaxID=210409 RepID=A0A5B7IJ01_PORTR|nr:hypothetical protein [Portunus trituberculatus]
MQICVVSAWWLLKCKLISHLQVISGSPRFIGPDDEGEDGGDGGDGDEASGADGECGVVALQARVVAMAIIVL